MSDETFMGVPRKDIPWCPEIDYDKCDFCMECDEFCPHRVFERRDDEEKKLVVANPDNCVVFCRVCAKACALDAIAFPDKDKTIDLIKQLKEGAGSTTASAEGKDSSSFASPVEYREIVQGKFIFKVPVSGFFFNENDCWARVDGNIARIGVSDYVQQSASDMVSYDPPAVGKVIDQFDDAGSLETTKTALDIISPVSGVVVAVNEKVIDEPEIINGDPYESGWTCVVELSVLDEDKELLMDCEKYYEYLEDKVRKEHEQVYGE